MKKIATLLLAAGMLLGAAGVAKAIDFKAKGEWIFGMGVSESSFLASPGSQGQDVFKAQQRVRLQLDAIASEALSGTIYFEIGDQRWGKGSNGGALGADGVRVEVKRAYLDWTVPNTDLMVRMGIQGVTLPNVAGGSAVMDDDVAGLTATYKFNDMASATFTWFRPLNDNYSRNDDIAIPNRNPNNYLDNVDMFALAVPVTLDGVKLTPWAAFGIVGQSALTDRVFAGDIGNGQPMSLASGYTTRDLSMSMANGDKRNWRSGGRGYGDLFFVGLPISITAFDPFNIEVDINYGYSTGFGKYDVEHRDPSGTRYYGRGDSSRAGWLIKALAEYKMDWGTPGILAWYASGDDDDAKNGSERMPSISPCGNFTSFMGDGAERGWSIDGGYDLNLTYDGTWGVGLQLKDMSFVENLNHTFRAVYWGGTNHPGMIKHLTAGYNDNPFNAARGGFSPYLTTKDYLVEFNLDSVYKVYENLNAIVELGYIVNGFDKDAWRKSSYQSNFTKADGYKANLIMQYAF